MCRYRTASATIAQLMVAVFVSLHRDSESAKNHFPSWRKIFLQLGKMKKDFWGKARIASINILKSYCL